MKEVIARYTDNGYGNVVGEIVEDLIRCKDCKHRVYLADLSVDGVVEWHGCDDLYDREGNPMKVDDNDFCSKAERREDD